MAVFTTYLDNALINHALGRAPYTMPAVYVGLSTTTPTVGGGNVAEPAIGTNAYARVQTSGFSFTASSGGTSATIPTTNTTGIVTGMVVQGVGISSTITVVTVNANTSIVLSSSITFTASVYNCSSWSYPSTGSISNTPAISFPTSTGSWSANPCTYLCFYDAASGGNLLAFEPITTPFTVNQTGITPSAATGQITTTIN
jgi:hypothetical protein